MVEAMCKVLWLILAGMVALASVARGQKVPCYYIFGDATVDNGNNNDLNTQEKVNYSPYGVDFPRGPTGRFSNGRNLADFIATLVGFNESIPPFARAPREQAYIGLNYASGGSGIREETGINLGERISLRRQIDNHERAIITAAVPRSRLKQCLYTINTGSNDYINNYFLPNSLSRTAYTPDQYARSLRRLYSLYLRELYILGVRKVALFGIGRIGCTPLIIARLGNGATGCVEEVNQAADLFNNELRALVIDLNNVLSGLQATYADLSYGTAEVYAREGITVDGMSCCTVNAGGKLCVPNGPICPDRDSYIFWDNLHTTEAVNEVNANLAFNGTTTFQRSISEILN